VVPSAEGGEVTLGEAWEAHADDWIRWARTSGHDEFWDGTWPELEAVLPPPSDGLVVEVGCGEGRVGRKLLEQGRLVLGIELSATLSRACRTGDPPLSVVQADAAHLPLADAAAASVVACMSLLDVDDLTGAVAEAARILRPGGRLCVAIVHPFASAQDPDAMHTHDPTISRPYLEERRHEDLVERGGLAMTFVSVHRPLSAYVTAGAAAGLVMTTLREFGSRPIPWLLTAAFEKPARQRRGTFTPSA
jgi:SAM-dependent methyltransferase